MTVQATPPSPVLPTLSLVTDIRVRNWASELVLVCLDDPLTRRAYELVFANCRDLRWSSDETESISAEATEADIIGFRPGQASYVEPAILTTDLFELSILYDRLEVRETMGDSARGRRELATTGG